MSKPGYRRGPRPRPHLIATVGADVNAALRARAASVGAPFSRIVDEALRKGLGLPAAAPPSASPNP
jgi:hypothetical protein